MSPGHRHRPARHSRPNSDDASSREQDIMGVRNIARPSSRQQRRDELGGGIAGPRRRLTGSSTSGSSEEAPIRYEGYKSETR